MSIEWKKTTIFGATFGIAAAITMFLAGGVISWLSNRPKQLDTTAIKAVDSRATQTFTIDDARREITPSGFTLGFVLANTTGRDLTVPEDVKLFKRDTKTQALSELNGKLDHAFFIPAKDKAEVEIRLEYSCADLDMKTGITTQRDPQICYNDAIGSVSGFLALDYGNHIRIELPKPTLASAPGK
ncbi:hypothetical protein AB4Y89_11400 [Terriglobus sp. 2YAB30_2]|uniref:hypothetical protein n=1 Tax=Terriglobus sp. 2YAB30_2 TaxID=3233023 RepID=UPI003F99A119